MNHNTAGLGVCNSPAQDRPMECFEDRLRMGFSAWCHTGVTVCQIMVGSGLSWFQNLVNTLRCLFPLLWLWGSCVSPLSLFTSVKPSVWRMDQHSVWKVLNLVHVSRGTVLLLRVPALSSPYKEADPAKVLPWVAQQCFPRPRYRMHLCVAFLWELSFLVTTDLCFGFKLTFSSLLAIYDKW